jgi:hypothetical protein
MEINLVGKHQIMKYSVCDASLLGENIFSRVWATTDGVWISIWIYWPLTDRNYKQL